MGAHLIAELIDRLQKSTGPDRKLDFDIWLNATPEGIRDRECPPSELKKPWDQWFECWKHDRSVIPSYTASIDAAAMLVPSEDWWWSCGHCKRENHATVGHEHATTIELDAIDGFGANVAIALCIASLRARAAFENSSRATE